MAAALQAVKGYLRGRVLLLPASKSLVLGRSLESDLVLFGGTVDERHAEIRAVGSGHQLVPRGKKPVRLGGKRIKKAVPLAQDDTFELGAHQFIYHAEAPDSHLRDLDRRLHATPDLERYRMLRKIAANQAEITYLGIDQDTGDRQGIRILKAERQAHPLELRKFIVRALIGLVLGNEYFLEVHGLRTSGGILYAVLDHVESAMKLEQFVREKSPATPLTAIEVSRQLAEILAFARTRRIVVAKRKKSGVLVARNGSVVRVQAFDPTRELERELVHLQVFRDLCESIDVDPVPLVEAGFPEPKNEADARLGQLADEYAEAYSVGRILFHLLTGRGFAPSVVKEVQAAGILRRRDREAAPLYQRLPLKALELLERALVPRHRKHHKTLDSLIEDLGDTAELLLEETVAEDLEEAVDATEPEELDLDDDD
ncbi:MAG: FHA domain-containing protein [Planctomycetes bacterium]|nr:FHA domain-containing protein [Planctomycetota bacterium]